MEDENRNEELHTGLTYYKVVCMSKAVQQAVVDIILGLIFVTMIVLGNVKDVMELSAIALLGLLTLGASMWASLVLHDGLIEKSATWWEDVEVDSKLDAVITFCNRVGASLAGVCLLLVTFFV
jgi:tetrahydromethanopterin S-methyltransferase subunit E